LSQWRGLDRIACDFCGRQRVGPDAEDEIVKHERTAHAKEARAVARAQRDADLIQRAIAPTAESVTTEQADVEIDGAETIVEQTDLAAVEGQEE
jgi:hypothetical protein